MSQNEEQKDVQLEALHKTLEWMQEDSQDFKAYMKIVEAEKTSTNSNAICCFCWCLLTPYQRKGHLEAHKEGIRTPGKYCLTENFKALARYYAHLKKENDTLYYPKFKNEPLSSTQIAPSQLKKLKKAEDQVTKQKEEPIQVNLSKSTKREEKSKLDYFSLIFHLLGQESDQSKTSSKVIIFYLS